MKKCAICKEAGENYMTLLKEKGPGPNRSYFRFVAHPESTRLGTILICSKCARDIYYTVKNKLGA